MTPRILFAVAVALLGGSCRDRDASPALKPTQRYAAKLWVPTIEQGGNDVASVSVEIRGPADCYVQSLGNRVNLRCPGSPIIELLSLGEDAGNPAPSFKDRECHDFGGTLVSSESSSSGWLSVCRKAVTDGNPLQGDTKERTFTRIIRDLHWTGNEFQCVVELGAAPRTAVQELINICDTVKIRSITLELKGSTYVEVLGEPGP